MEFIKNKKILLILLSSFIFIILIIGFVSLMNSSKSSIGKLTENENINIYKNELNKYPEFKDLLNILKGGDEDLQKEALNYLKAEIIKTESTKIEIEAKLLKEINPYINAIKINNTKDDKVYVEEFKKEIEKLKYLTLDFNDKNNLRIGGEYILNVTNNISKIEVPKNYYNLHKSSVILLGMMGKALVELSQTEDSEKAIALLLILNNLANLQEKIFEKL